MNSRSSAMLVSDQESVEETDVPEGRHPHGDKQLWSKLLLIICVPIIPCLLSFLIVTSSFCIQHADPPWIRSSSAIYRAHNVPCQVVIFGDSTAVTGIDPASIERDVHMNACNLGQTKGTLVVLGSRALDRYLATNPRPQYLIFVYSAYDYYSSHSWKNTAYIEGAVEMLRYYPKIEFIKSLARNPDLFIGMAHYAYLTAPATWYKNRRVPDDPALASSTKTQTINAHMTLPSPPFTQCSQTWESEQEIHLPEPEYIRDMRARYANAADHVLLDVAPLPVCDARISSLRQQLRGLDNQLESYPVNAFNEGYTHFSSAGSERLSADIARQITSVESSRTASADAISSGGSIWPKVR